MGIDGSDVASYDPTVEMLSFILLDVLRVLDADFLVPPGVRFSSLLQAPCGMDTQKTQYKKNTHFRSRVDSGRVAIYKQ